MRNGACPKCGSEDLRRQEGGRTQQFFLTLGFFKTGLPVLTYLCVSCGYIEEYARPGDLEAIARKWPPVNPEAGKV